MTIDLREVPYAPGFLLKTSLLILIGLILGCACIPLARSAGAEDVVIKPGVSAAELAREVVLNELNAQDLDKSLWQYRQVREEDGKTKVLEVVETNDGEVHRLLAVNGNPLSGKERQNEDRRIQKLLANPDEFRERQKNAARDAEQERKLLKMLPEAFLYAYDGDGGEDGLIKLKFQPNPEFHANGHESELFHHMEGVMLVDPRQKRLAEIDGQLLSEVKFWDGILGHLDKGGTFRVEQKDVGGGHWEMVELDIRMSGKALFFKSISVHEKQTDSDFRPLPDNTSLKQAAEFLAVNTTS
jgi:hypothetical protein